MPLVLAGVGSTVCTLLILSTGAGVSTLGPAALTVVSGVVGIGWNGVQHTWLAELAGPRAAGDGGRPWAWRSPPRASRWGRCSSGTSCRSTGGYRWPWLGLATAMVGALGTSPSSGSAGAPSERRASWPGK